MAHGPVDRAVKGGIGFAPGACLDTSPAAGALLVAYPHGCAFLHIIGPLFIVVVHDLVPMTDRTGRAFTRAFLTGVTEILEAEINGFVRRQRKVGGHHRSLEACTQLGIEHDITNATHLPKARPQQNRRQYHPIVQGVVGPSGITQLTDIIGQDAGNKSGGGI